MDDSCWRSEAVQASVSIPQHVTCSVDACVHIPLSLRVSKQNKTKQTNKRFYFNITNYDVPSFYTSLPLPPPSSLPLLPPPPLSPLPPPSPLPSPLHSPLPSVLSMYVSASGSTWSCLRQSRYVLCFDVSPVSKRCHTKNVNIFRRMYVFPFCCVCVYSAYMCYVIQHVLYG